MSSSIGYVTSRTVHEAASRWWRWAATPSPRAGPGGHAGRRSRPTPPGGRRRRRPVPVRVAGGRGPRQRPAGRQPRHPAGGRGRPRAGPAAALPRRDDSGPARQRPRAARSTARCGPGSAVAVVTHVDVDPADPAFDDPTKPIGPFFTAGRGRRARRASAAGRCVEDSGRGYRRVVPSPRPAGSSRSRADRGPSSRPGTSSSRPAAAASPVATDAAGRSSASTP